MPDGQQPTALTHVVCWACSSLFVIPLAALGTRFAGGTPPSTTYLVIGAMPVVVALVLVGIPRLRRLLSRLVVPSLPVSRAGGVWLGAGWLLAVLVCMRLTAFMADPSLTQHSVFPLDPPTVRHQAVAAYVYGAELNREGTANIYDPALYPDPGEAGAPAPTSVDNLQQFIEEPFLYPPPFVLLPRSALILSNDFLLIRAAVYTLNVWLVLATALALIAWVGRDPGRFAAYMLPVVFIAMPVQFCFQFGQFHLAAVSMALLAAALAATRPRVAGALLGAAVAFKLFPGVLLLYWAGRRRWRALGASLITLVTLSAVTWVVAGSDIFFAFATDHFPRILAGRHLEIGLATAHSPYNVSVFGLVLRLRLLGFESLDFGAARLLNALFSVMVVLLALYTGRRQADRARQVAVWLGLLTLAALRSPLAPIAYYPATGFWLLSWLVAISPSWRRRIGVLVLAWIFLSPTPPMGSPQAQVVVSALCPLLLLFLSVRSTVWSRPATEASD